MKLKSIKRLKRGGQYPAILTKRALSIKHLTYGQENVFLAGPQVEILRGKIGLSGFLGQSIKKLNLLHLAYSLKQLYNNF